MVTNNSHIKISDDAINDFRLPNLSEKNPHNGAVIIIARKTLDDKIQSLFSGRVSYQDVHSKTGDKSERIVASMASVKTTHPAARDNKI